MNRRLVFKLLPVALLAAVGLFWAANAPPRAAASVGAISPATFVANPSASFTFTADSSGVIGVTAVSVAPVTLSASCTGCSVIGTNPLSISPPAGTIIFTVSLTLTASCTTSGIPISVTASQGVTSTTATGFTGSCSVSCSGLFTTACCDGVFFTSACGCGFGTTSLLLGNCGCGFGSTTFGLTNCGCGFGSTSFGITNCGCGLGTTSLLLSGCGCGLGVSSFGITNCGCGFGTTNFGLTNGLNSCGCSGLTGSNFILGTGTLAQNCGVQQVVVTVPGNATCGSTTNVLVTVRNTIGGVLIDGTPVGLVTTAGVITPSSTRTTGGIATATLVLPATGVGTATITASTGGVIGQASIQVSCGVAPVAVQPVQVPVQPVIIVGPNTGDGGCFVHRCNSAPSD
jgi:hypothetical protein